MSASHYPSEAALIPQLNDLYKKMEYKPGYEALAMQAANRLFFDGGRYFSFVSTYGLKIPPVFVMCVAERESGGSWGAYLGNGESWNKKTTIAPVGRGAWTSWESAAMDAINFQGFDKLTDWSVGSLAYRLIDMNGWGYWYHGILASPYAFAGSTLQVPGKYPTDGVFDPEMVDPQVGGLLIYKALAQLDPGLALPE